MRHLADCTPTRLKFLLFLGEQDCGFLNFHSNLSTNGNSAGLCVEERNNLCEGSLSYNPIFIVMLEVGQGILR